MPKPRKTRKPSPARAASSPGRAATASARPATASGRPAQGANRTWESTRRAIAGHRSLLALVAVLIGALVGLASVLFDLMIRAWSWVGTGYTDYAAHAGAAHGWLGIPAWVFLLLLPVVSGLLYGPLVARFAPSARGHGIPEVMLAVARNGGRIPGRVAIVKLIASSLTIGGGGSAGREGPIVQVGAALGSWLAGLLRLPTSRVVLLAAAGGAGGIAATFHAPLAGAVFALEVILAAFSAESFGYVVLSSVAASVTARSIQGSHTLVDIGASLNLASLTDMGWVALVGLGAGLVGLGFSKLLYLVEDAIDWLWGKIGLPEWSRPAVLGLLLGAGLVAAPILYGSGGSVQLAALSGEYSIGVLLLLMLGRALYTSWTIGMGGSGGVFAPTLFLGALAGSAFGQAIAHVTGASPALYGVIGMGAAFAGAARAPLTGVLIIVEMTEQYALILPLMLAVVLATAASRYLTRATIYTEKLRRRGDALTQPIDRTLLGRRSAQQLMGSVPAVLSPATTLAQAAAQMQRAGVSSLPVCRSGNLDGEFLGVVTALDLAACLQDSATSPTLATVKLHHESVPPTALPSQILSHMVPGGPESLPVLDEDGRLVGWLSQHDVIARVQGAQLRALEQGKQSSWGSRYLDKRKSKRK
ncbi:MAG: chloride channel protein [Buchananella hordeovulneris]|nr:chloride channel protein [Buchananella hordeovulneris]